MKRPNCIRCRNYFVTWENPHSHGCRAYGFKSQEAPSNVVFKTSGTPCQFYDEKPEIPKEYRSPKKRPQSK